jgi:tetratricopeptide (TPR) repeat protein
VPTFGEEAQRHVELAAAAAAAFDVDAAVANMSAAIRGFTAAGDNRNAALACARLGDLYATWLGNLAVGRAWYARATRLVADEPPCLEQGWVAVAPMGCDVDDPAELLDRAELALDRARRFGDVNLETKALADAGLAHVQAGRVREGMALLDEAMALVCGPADDTDVAGKSVCSFFTACYFAADFVRAGSWAGLLRRRGLIGTAPVVPVFLGSHCDSVQATLLCELGQWGAAEALLTRATAEFEAALPMPSWHTAIALADLRIRQGRLADAEMLLLGKDGSLQALLPMARLHLVRGDHDLARATAARGLRALGSDRLRAAELLTVLVDVELAVGDLAAATAASTELDARTRGLNSPALLARAAAARARTLAAGGDLAGAIGAIEGAVEILPDTGTPWLRAGLHIELARLQERAGQLAVARVAATAATAMLTGLDGALPADDRAVLGGWSGTHPLRVRPACAGTVVGGRPPAGTPECGCRTRRGCATSPSWWRTRGPSGMCSISSTASKACRRARTRPLIGIGWATRARSSTAGRARRTDAGSRRSAPRSRTHSRRASTAASKRCRTSWTSSWRNSPGHSGWADVPDARVRRPSGPGSTSPVLCGRPPAN